MRNNASIDMEKLVLDRNALTPAFKALSDPTRLRILRLLAVNRSQMCVCEFVDTLQERQYNVSKHLKILEQAGLIESEKEGRFLYYGLVDGGDAMARVLYRLVAGVPDSDEVFSDDQSRFEERMELREDGRCRLGIQTEELAE